MQCSYHMLYNLWSVFIVKTSSFQIIKQILQHVNHLTDSRDVKHLDLMILTPTVIADLLYTSVVGLSIYSLSFYIFRQEGPRIEKI